MSEESQVLTILLEHGNKISTVISQQCDTKERLFGTNGTPGVITYLAAADKSNADQLTTLKDLVMSQKAATDLALQAHVNAVKLELASRDAKRATDRAYVVGFSAAVGLLIKAGLSKLGWHF